MTWPHWRGGWNGFRRAGLKKGQNIIGSCPGWGLRIDKYHDISVSMMPRNPPDVWGKCGLTGGLRHQRTGRSEHESRPKRSVVVNRNSARDGNTFKPSKAGAIVWIGCAESLAPYEQRAMGQTATPVPPTQWFL